MIKRVDCLLRFILLVPGFIIIFSNPFRRTTKQFFLSFAQNQFSALLQVLPRFRIDPRYPEHSPITLFQMLPTFCIAFNVHDSEPQCLSSRILVFPHWSHFLIVTFMEQSFRIFVTFVKARLAIPRLISFSSLPLLFVIYVPRHICLLFLFNSFQKYRQFSSIRRECSTTVCISQITNFFPAITYSTVQKYRAEELKVK